MVLIVLLSQCLVFENQPFNVSEDMGLDSSVPGKLYRLQPELALSVGRGHMDVRRLIAFIRVEVESEAANP
jgi:hypothetical protein